MNAILLFLISTIVFYFIIETAVKNGINKSNIGQRNDHNNHDPFIKNDLDD